MTSHSTWRLAAAATAACAMTLTGLTPANSHVASLLPEGGAPTTVVPTTEGSGSEILTLITGDQLAVTAAADGRQSVTILKSAGTSARLEVESGPDGDIYAFPDAALAAVDAGVVDAELFNVTRALADGYGDADTASLSAIVEFEGAKGSRTAPDLRSRTDKLPGSRRERAMPRLGLASLKVDKAMTKKFWAQVRPAIRTTSNGRTRSVPGSAGVAKLWYDGMAQASLDHSVPQIGAPDAWALGYDGTGTTVAILDTGIDAGHDDVSSRVTASRSFVSGQEVQDGHGHGTHVASTVAGSGELSSGRLKGVAPGADLLVAKVLGNNGKGPVSGILAGMDWAVAQQADVINMSLGSENAVAGGDILTRAVDRLSAESDTLFVVAASNEGPGDQTLGTPGTADSALTVGAIDKSGKLAGFSSRGPRKGDFAIKPDITAPGVGIVAARAAGTSMGSPVDANYTAASGTSMATPHVAGAAAILKQAHPTWDGERIKRALTTTAHVAPEQTVYQQGHGQAFIPDALNTTIDLAGRADFGLIEWVPGSHPLETRTLRYTNHGATDTSLTLATTFAKTDGTPTSGHVTLTSPNLTADQLTVPAGGTVDLTVTLDPNGLAFGSWYGGHVVATTPDGLTLNAPIGAAMDVERHEVTLNFTDRNGAIPSAVRYTLHGMSNDTWISENLNLTGTKSYLLPLGDYSVEGTLSTRFPGATSGDLSAYDLFSLPNIMVVDGPVTASIDGTTAAEFSVTVNGEDRPLERSTYMSVIDREGDYPNANYFRGTANLLSTGDLQIGAIPSDPAQVGELHLFNFLAQREPLSTLTVKKPVTKVLPVFNGILSPRLDRKITARLVDGGTGTPTAAQAAGAIVLLTQTPDADLRARVASVQAAGAAAVITARGNAGPTNTPSINAEGPIPLVGTDFTTAQKLRTLLDFGPVTLSLNTIQESRAIYSSQFVEAGAIPASLAETASVADFVKVKTSYHTDRVRHLGQDVLNVWSPDQETSLRTAQYTQFGLVRDDFVLANASQIFQHSVHQTPSNATIMKSPLRRYQSGGQVTNLSWYKASAQLSQYEDGPCNFCRGDWFMLSYITTADSDPQHQRTGGYQLKVATYRDGVLYPDQTSLLVKESAEYRFVMTQTRNPDVAGVTLNPTIKNDFTFTSAAPKTMAIPACDAFVPTTNTCESLPMVLIGSQLPVDINNQAAAGRRFVFTLDGAHGKGWSGSTSIAGATVQVSYDNGTNWQAAQVTRSDTNSFKVIVQHPELAETDGYVSVRSEMWDALGNRTVQTVTRAYALK